MTWKHSRRSADLVLKLDSAAFGSRNVKGLPGISLWQDFTFQGNTVVAILVCGCHVSRTGRNVGP